MPKITYPTEMLPRHEGGEVVIAGKWRCTVDDNPVCEAPVICIDLSGDARWAMRTNRTATGDVVWVESDVYGSTGNVINEPSWWISPPTVL